MRAAKPRLNRCECGGEARYRYQPHRLQVRCERAWQFARGICARTNWYDTEKQAASRWNRRAKRKVKT